jgi:hypothetical protein
LQAITGGPTVTIKYAATPIGGGAYSLTGLPVAAPRYVSYSTTLPLGFVAAITTPAAGSYRVDASTTGYASQSLPAVDVSGASQTSVNFTLTP